MMQYNFVISYYDSSILQYILYVSQFNSLTCEICQPIGSMYPFGLLDF